MTPPLSRWAAGREDRLEVELHFLTLAEHVDGERLILGTAKQIDKGGDVRNLLAVRGEDNVANLHASFARGQARLNRGYSDV